MSATAPIARVSAEQDPELRGNASDRGVGADPDGQREDRDRGKERSPRQLSQGQTNLPKDLGHRLLARG
jgi:hypothetical protein